MKHLISLFLALILPLSLLGCAAEAPIEEPLLLYYRTASDENDLPTQAIGMLTVEGKGLPSESIDILNTYLSRPAEEGYSPTFSSGSKIVYFSISGTIATVIVNANFAKHTGIDLTLACACLTLTTVRLTGAHTVCIRAQQGTLDGKDQIVMDENCMILLDGDRN